MFELIQTTLPFQLQNKLCSSDYVGQVGGSPFTKVPEWGLLLFGVLPVCKMSHFLWKPFWFAENAHNCSPIEGSIVMTVI